MKTACTALVLTITAAAASAQERTFVAEGSDAVQGVGARYLAMGGTGVATANDPHAVYYNPALLADIDRVTLSITRQIDADLRPYSFAGIAVPIAALEDSGIDLTLAAARYNRIHARSTGAYGANEPESIFLRYLLPGIKGTFSGDIDSKTLVNRVAVGMRFDALPQFSFGANLDYIDCRTETCGVHTSSNGYETQSVHATAVSYGFSASYRPTDRLTFGVAYTDIDTELKVHRIVTDDAGTRKQVFTTPFVRKVAAEAAYRFNDKWLVAFGGKREWGDYGSYSLDFLTLHGGLEYTASPTLTLRAGAWGPLRLETSQANNFDIPVPLAPTAGMGWTLGDFTVDAAIYGHPLMTLHENYPAVSGDLTLSYRF